MMETIMTEVNSSRILYTEGEVESEPIEVPVKQMPKKAITKKVSAKKTAAKKTTSKKASVKAKPLKEKVKTPSMKTVTVAKNSKDNKKTVSLSTYKRRPDFKFSILNDWKSKNKSSLKVGTTLIFTKNDKITATIQDDGRLLLVAGKEVDGVDDSARHAFKVSKLKHEGKTIDGLKFWKTSEGKTLRQLFTEVKVA